MLDITLSEELDLNDYTSNLTKMYGAEIMKNVIGSVTGDVKFYGLTRTSMKLEGLDKHRRLIESYQKLHKARDTRISKKPNGRCEDSKAPCL